MEVVFPLLSNSPKLYLHGCFSLSNLLTVINSGIFIMIQGHAGKGLLD